MFNFGDNVDRDTVIKVERAGNSQPFDKSATNRRVAVADLSPVLATVDSVAGVYRALRVHSHIGLPALPCASLATVRIIVTVDVHALRFR